MIYLIGGAPRCGKTTLARKLSKELGISWISADDIEQEAKMKLSDDQKVNLFPKDVIREKTKSSNDIMYAEYSAEEIMTAYIRQARASWPAITELVEDKIAAGEGIIIEGFQVEPELISELKNKFGEDKIRAVVLAKNNVDEIVETARAGQDPDDWFIKKTTDPAIHFKIAKMLAKYSEYFESEADRYDIVKVEYNGNFEEQIGEALKLLAK